MEETHGSSSNLSQFVTLKSFCCNYADGGTIIVDNPPPFPTEAEIIKSWEDYEIGQRYVGLISDPSMIAALKKLGAAGDNPTKVYFGPTDIVDRGGLSASALHTLRLIKRLANDLDPERPKFKSTLDSIEAQVQELKKALKIDRVVQESSIKEN